MARYTIEMKHIASIIEVVEANDEGDALEKARIKAENADMNEFVLKEEIESRVINVQ